MPKKRFNIPADVQVIIPYSDLVELLKASYEVAMLREEQKRLRSQMSALRLQFTELVELYNTYQD